MEDLNNLYVGSEMVDVMNTAEIAAVATGLAAAKSDASGSTPKSKAAKTTGPKKTIKKKNDPNAPRRPKSAYLEYGDTRRPDIRKENPDMTFTDVGKLLGEEWRALSDLQKKPYQDKYEAAKAQYKIDQANYKPDLKDASKKEKKKKAKDPNAPKRPATAYLEYANIRRPDIRKENPDMSFADVGKLLGEEWRAMSDEMKKPYQDKYEEAKVKYEKEKATYDAKKH